MEDEMAIEQFSIAISKEPNFVKALINRGDLYFKRRDYVKALHDYNVA